MSVPEAMAAARPVVVSEIGGTGEAVAQASPACWCRRATPRRPPGPCWSWRVIGSGRGAWVRPAARANATASTVRRWLGLPAVAEKDGRWRIGRTCCWSRRYHARLAGGRPPVLRADRACGGLDRGRDRSLRLGRPAAARLPGERPGGDARRARALQAALGRHQPRAVILSTTTAAMLAPRLELPYAVRPDAPARLNRPGRRNALLRELERRGLPARGSWCPGASPRPRRCPPAPHGRWWSRRR